MVAKVAGYSVFRRIADEISDSDAVVTRRHVIQLEGSIWLDCRTECLLLSCGRVWQVPRRRRGKKRDLKDFAGNRLRLVPLHKQLSLEGNGAVIATKYGH